MLASAIGVYFKVSFSSQQMYIYGQPQVKKEEGKERRELEVEFTQYMAQILFDSEIYLCLLCFSD